MMTFSEMCQRFGKEKARDMAVNHRVGGQTGADKDRGIKGRVRFRKCPHGVWIIDDYKPRPCLNCAMASRQTKSADFKPGFNLGLGAWVESRQEERQFAKASGLQEAG